MSKAFLKAWKSSRPWVFGLFPILLLLILFLGYVPTPLQAAAYIGFGWIAYIRKTLPTMSIAWRPAMLCAIALCLAAHGLHRAFCGWARRRDPEAQWPFRTTAKMVFMILLLFGAAISATGITHEIGWLFGARDLTRNGSVSHTMIEMYFGKGLFYRIKMFAQDHEGRPPKSLEALIPEYLDSRRLIFMGGEDDEPPEPILYFDHDSNDVPDDWIIIASPHPCKRRWIVQWNGEARVITETEFHDRLAKQQRPEGEPL